MDISLWKKRKKELHLTHDQLAAMSGVSRRTIAGIFSGNEKYQSPTMNTVEAIERALGISDLTAEEREAGAVDSTKVTLTPDELALIETFRAVGEKYGKDKQALAMKILETMTE